MRKALATLLRVRSIEKRVAKTEFAEAERVRNLQEQRVDGIKAAMEQSRAASDLGAGGSQACWVAHEHAHRLRLEVDLRRESGILHKRTVIATRRRVDLTEADRAERVVELALEKHDEQVALETRRADGRRLDAMASARWWRENS